MTDTQGYVRGKMSSDAKYELSLNLYLDWLETAEEDYIYSGCGGADYIESLITRQDVIKNDTGYDSVVEEFTFVDVAKIFSDYSEEYVLVTLADGSKIKVTETMADSTGTVVVNWNDNNNVVVTVNQTNVSLGQVTVVDLVKQSVRDEEMMYGLVNSHTYRCFSNY